MVRHAAPRRASRTRSTAAAARSTTADATCSSTATSRPTGHDFFDVGAFDGQPDHSPAGVVERRRRRRALHAARPRPGHRCRPRRRARRDTSSWGGVAWSADGQLALLRPPRRADAPVPRSGATASARRRRRRAGVRRSPTSASTSASAPTRSEQLDRHPPGSKTSSEVWLIPAADPTAAPRLVRAAADDVEYSVDTGATGSSSSPTSTRRDFRVMTAPLDAPGDWTELIAHVARAPDHVGSSRSPATSCCTSGATPSPRSACCSRDGRERCSTSAPSRTTSSSGANPEWDTTTLRLTLPVADDAGSVFDVDVVTGERTLRKQTPTPNVDLDRYVVGAAVGHRRRRHPGARRRRPPRRHARSTAPRPPSCTATAPTRLDAAVVLGRPAVAARPRRRVGARPPARWRRARPPAGTSTASCCTSATRSPTRSPCAEHLVAAGCADRRPAGDPRRQRRRPARRRLRHDAPDLLPGGRRRGAVRRRRHDDERRRPCRSR